MSTIKSKQSKILPITSQQQQLESQKATTISNAIPDDLGEAIEQSDIIDDPVVDDTATQDGVLVDGILSREQFTQTFISAFNVTSGITKLQSLHIEIADQQAIICAGAIYDYATEIPQLRFLIEPSNVHVQRALAILPFVYFKYAAVRAELQARKAEMAKEAEVETTQAADEQE